MKKTPHFGAATRHDGTIKEVKFSGPLREQPPPPLGEQEMPAPRPRRARATVLFPLCRPFAAPLPPLCQARIVGVEGGRMLRMTAYTLKFLWPLHFEGTFPQTPCTGTGTGEAHVHGKPPQRSRK
eukprot:gene11411-biopygen13928